MSTQLAFVLITLIIMGGIVICTSIVDEAEKMKLRQENDDLRWKNRVWQDRLYEAGVKEEE